MIGLYRRWKALPRLRRERFWESFWMTLFASVGIALVLALLLVLLIEAPLFCMLVLWWLGGCAAVAYYVNFRRNRS